MMAERKLRKEDQLTTADLAGRPANTPDETTYPEYHATDPRRPQLVRRDSQSAVSDTPLGSPVTNEWQATPSATDVTGVPTLPDARAENALDETQMKLFSDADIGDLRSRWSDVQAGFVDEPRRSVEQADQLVATVMQRLAEGFANERATLEKQWDSGSNVSTEDLRVALQRYRAFFGRLLNAA